MPKPHSIAELVQSKNEPKIRAILNTPGGSIHLEEVVRGLALTGQGRLLLELVANTRFYPVALESAATAGHFQIVNDLLAQSNDMEHNQVYALIGASIGRHFLQVANFLSQGLNPMVCLNALSPEGKLKQTDIDALLAEITDDSLKQTIQALATSQFEVEQDSVFRV